MRISFVLEISHMWQRNKPGIYRSTVIAKLRSKRIPPMEGWLNPRLYKGRQGNHQKRVMGTEMNNQHDILPYF